MPLLGTVSQEGSLRTYRSLLLRTPSLRCVASTSPPSSLSLPSRFAGVFSKLQLLQLPPLARNYEGILPFLPFRSQLETEVLPPPYWQTLCILSPVVSLSGERPCLTSLLPSSPLFFFSSYAT